MAPVVKAFLRLVGQDQHFVSVTRGKHTLYTVNGNFLAMCSAKDVLGNVSAVLNRDGCLQVVQYYKSELIAPSGNAVNAEDKKEG